MKLELAQIAEILGAELDARFKGADTVIDDVSVDTRKPLGPSSLFVALQGPNFDGHAFVDDALNAGAFALVKSTYKSDSERLVRVEGDTLDALQRLAAHWRARFEGPVVGITGSNGKTIVKEMLAAIVSQRLTVYRSPGSYNSQVGVALSLLSLDSLHDVAIIEAGISQVGEMERLEAMIQPDHGILTFIGSAHQAGLPSLETTAREKLKLFARTDGFVVAPQDTLVFEGWPERPIPMSFGQSKEADVEVHSVEQSTTGFLFELDHAEEQLEVRLNVVGRHNVDNAAAAALMARALGLDDEAIRAGLASFELAPMRLEMHTTSTGITLINDAYSSDPISARSALAALQFYAGPSRTVAILGGMHDLGEASEKEHFELGKQVNQSGIERLFCIGPEAEFIARGALEAGMQPDAVAVEHDLAVLHDALDAALLPGDFVLFKGSRSLGLERAAERLLESVAPTRLTIDLDALRSNYRSVREAVGRQTKIMAVVKSFAYGNDSTRVSQTLVREGVDALAVAYPDEAIPLRNKGIRVPVLVTNVLANEADKIVKYDLTALIYSRHVASALDRQAARRDAVIDVHVEIDSGMGRVGLHPDDAVDFLKFVAELENVRATGLMTHFAVADDPREDDYTRAQLERFDAVRAALAGEGFEFDTIHAANTAGVARFEEARYDMVRVGLGLYGYHPGEHGALDDALKPALKFSTRVVHLKWVEAGDSVSYGRTWKAPGKRRIATIAAGYNDGFSRYNSNGAEVLINGVRCPVVGTVCMDVSMVDVTGADVELGDEVVLFGESRDAYIGPEEVAARGDTIHYEVLCKVAPRVKRIFTRTT